MEPIVKDAEEFVRFQLVAEILLRLFRVFARSRPKADQRAQLHLHLSLLSDAELADYGLRRKAIADFVDSGVIERP